MKSILLTFLSFLLLFSLCACGQEAAVPKVEAPTPTAQKEPPQEEPPAEKELTEVPMEILPVSPQKEGYIALQDVLDHSKLFYSYENGRLSLVEDAIQIDLMADSNDISYNGSVLGQMEKPFLYENEILYLPMDFYENYLLSEQNTVSLRTGIPDAPGKISSDLTEHDRFYNTDPKEPEPWWPDLETFERLYDYGVCLGTVKDGVRRDFYEDRTVRISGNIIVNTYFDTYQKLEYYHVVWGPDYGLLDIEGDELVPIAYSEIQVPFPDRYLLFTGSVDSVEDTQAQLFAGDGTLLAEGANRYEYLRMPDGSYIGVAHQLHNNEDEPNHGNMEWFVDRDGKAISETQYKRLYFFDAQEGHDGESNGKAITMDNFRDLKLGFYGAYFVYGRDSQVEIQYPDTAFFYGITMDGEEEFLPLKDVLLSEAQRMD